MKRAFTVALLGDYGMSGGQQLYGHDSVEETFAVTVEPPKEIVERARQRREERRAQFPERTPSLEAFVLDHLTVEVELPE